MKKIFLILLCLFVQTLASQAATQVKVTSMQSFSTDKPTENLRVKVREDVLLGNYELKESSELNCEIIKIVDPKRGKRNAKFFVKPFSYEYNGFSTTIEEEMYGKYSKKVLSKEELKKIPPTKIIGKAALTVGNHFVHGLSAGVSFAKGVITNEDNNRLKSGVKKAYKESPLSYIEEGEQISIQVGDEFYLIFKIEEDDAPNYSYTENSN